jgi:cyclopropane-fatty-acyl-phospholipid synthase
MLARTHQSRIQNALYAADIHIDGLRPWDLSVHDSRFYSQIASRGALGLGESYMDGLWDCADLAQLFCKLLRARLDRESSIHWLARFAALKSRYVNRQRRSRAAENVRRHYDQGNELYRHMLDGWMLYSSANWEHATNLEQAAESKLEFVCKRLNLQPGQRILDIGCGWGGFAKFAAQRYGVHVVGITVSSEQVKLARHSCADLPVEICYQDYRDLSGKFDHIISLGMFEHVGPRNHRTYMRVVQNCLKPGGLFFLNTIGANQTGYNVNLWTDKYIFPGSVLPSIAQIGAAVDGLFIMEELQDWAEFYDRTLVAWFGRFNGNWNQLKDKYSERFYRMWKYYLLSSAGAFRAKSIQDWQIVLSRA